MAHSPESARLKVLVVDDYMDTAEILSQMLELGGFRTAAARDGEEALDLAHALQPDVILLDIELPKRNGVEVCRTLRQEPRGAAIAIVAVTGHTCLEKVRWIMSAGFDCVLAKPCSYRTIEALLHSVPRLASPPDPQSLRRTTELQADAS